MERIEQVILSSLVQNEEYARKVIPYLKPEYFSDPTEKTLFTQINKFIEAYNVLPTQESLAIAVSKDQKITEGVYANLIPMLSKVFSKAEKPQDPKWLYDNTEEFCKVKAIFQALTKSIKIMDGSEQRYLPDAIPTLLQEALSVAFDPRVGHDYVDDAESRWESLTSVEARIPFDIDYLNQITNNGLPKKSFTVILAGTGVGKSLAMCHMASYNIKRGYNVLYLTAEMAEEKIAERIDANLMDIDIATLPTIAKDEYMRRWERTKKMLTGKLVIKEYPTSSAHAGHIRSLLAELKTKKNFIPDIIYVDYLNIFISHRIKASAGANSYTTIKSVAEELRGLAVEFCCPVVTATQTNRSGYDNSDAGLTDTSESFGVPMTADLMFALIASEELSALGQIMGKQLKNRYNDPEKNKRFILGVDKSRMRLYNVEGSAQGNLIPEPEPSSGFTSSKGRDLAKFGSLVTAKIKGDDIDLSTAPWD